MSDNIPRDFTIPGLYDFDSSEAILLDAAKIDKPLPPVGNATPKRGPEPTQHDKNTWDLQARLEKYTSCKVTKMHLKQKYQERALYDHIDKLLRTKTKHDLVIVWFNGESHWEGKKDGTDYSWRFGRGKYAWFNAYDIFRLCGESGVTCMFLLDCEIPVLWKKKLPTPKGHVSIFARGGQAWLPGNLVDHSSSFTGAFTDNVSDLAKDIYKGRHDMITTPMMMSPPQSKLSHPVNRVHDTLFKQSAKRHLEDIVYNPKKVRGNIAAVPGAAFGEVEFFIRVSYKARGSILEDTEEDTTGLAHGATAKDEGDVEVKFEPREPSESAAGTKRNASMMSGGDEGYDSDGNPLFVPKNQRREETP